MKSIICLIAIVLFSFNSWADDAEAKRKAKLERMSKEDLIIMYMILEDRNKMLKDELELQKKHNGVGKKKAKRVLADFYSVKDIISAIPKERMPHNGEKTMSKIHEKLCDEWASRSLKGRIFRGNLIYIRAQKDSVLFMCEEFSEHGLLFSDIFINVEFSNTGLLQMAKEKKRFFMPVVGKIESMDVYSNLQKNKNIISLNLVNSYLDENSTKDEERKKYVAKKKLGPKIKSLSRELKKMPRYCFPPAGEFKMTNRNVYLANQWISKNIVGKRYSARMQITNVHNFEKVLLTETKFSIGSIIFGKQYVSVSFSSEGEIQAAMVQKGTRIKVEGVIDSVKIIVPKKMGEPHGIRVRLKGCVIK